MKPIGGYFELELSSGEEYYPYLIRLNTARNALEYIMRIKKYEQIYIPFYACDVILEPLDRLGIKVQYYHIDKKLDPVIDFNLDKKSCFLYVNYFGIKESTVNRLSKTVSNLIIDNSMAFFSQPLAGVDCFYSCRKFFGAPDGAYLNLADSGRLQLDKDTSIHRSAHLFMRIESGAENGFETYKKNEELLKNRPLLEMSDFTKQILAGIDYENCKEKRNRNFIHLHEVLKYVNLLDAEFQNVNGPMVYPLLVAQAELREKLISHKIFVAGYWPNVAEWTNSNMYEYYLSEHLIPLPVDQRYGIKEMNRIIDIVMQY